VGLTGKLWETGGDDAAGQGRGQGLIGRYTDARVAGRQKQADKLLEAIDDILANHAEGDVRGVIDPAMSYRARITEDVKARANNFRKLLSEYNRSPRFFIERHWAAAREEILGAAGTEKFYVSLGKVPMVLRIGRDPEVVRKQLRERLKADAKDKGGK